MKRNAAIPKCNRIFVKWKRTMRNMHNATCGTVAVKLSKQSKVKYLKKTETKRKIDVENENEKKMREKTMKLTAVRNGN